MTTQERIYALLQEGKSMRVLDLFSGLGGWSAAFKERGHEVLTLDIEPKFKPDICKDILEVNSIDELGQFDVILASPPCEVFSIAAVWLKHWQKDSTGKYLPNDERAIKHPHLKRWGISATQNR
jgi:site-specific DNA-cytosine methylase